MVDPQDHPGNYTKEAFLDDMEEFMARTGMKPTNLSIFSMGERNFVQYVRMGRAPKPHTMDKVRKWMAEFEVQP
jgi:hypothetical protein